MTAPTAPTASQTPPVLETGLLFSYHYMGEGSSLVDYLGKLGHRPRVFIDSGGFSAFTQGKAIDLRAYARWLRVNAAGIDYYASLDVIGDPRGTLQNQLRLEREGLRPLPIVHFGTPASEVRRYAERGYRYLCLGGMVPHLGRLAQALRLGKDKDEGLAWMRACHEEAQTLGVDLHGFGVMTWNIMQAFPWRSTDSSSWNAGLRFGIVRFYDIKNHVWRSFRLRDIGEVMKHRNCLRAYGVDPRAIITDSEHCLDAVVVLQARSWKAATVEARRRGLLRPDFMLHLVDGRLDFLSRAIRSTAGWVAP